QFNSINKNRFAYAAATQLPATKPKATASGFRRAVSRSFSGASTSSALQLVPLRLRDFAPVKRNTGFPRTVVFTDSMAGGLPELRVRVKSTNKLALVILSNPLTR